MGNQTKLRDKRLKFGHDGDDCVIITSLASCCFEAYFFRRKVLVSVFLLMKINCVVTAMGALRGSNFQFHSFHMHEHFSTWIILKKKYIYEKRQRIEKRV